MQKDTDSNVSTVTLNNSLACHEIKSYISKKTQKTKRIKSLKNSYLKKELLGFPGGAVVKNPPANAGDMGSSPGPGRSHMPQSN